MIELLLVSLFGGGVVGSLVVLALRHNKLSDTLERVRFAALDLINGLQDDITDLQDSLKDAGIPLSCKHSNERMRRLSLPPEVAHAESLARFEEACARVEEVRKQL